jgi:hypothetical protein
MSDEGPKPIPGWPPWVIRLTAALLVLGLAVIFGFAKGYLKAGGLDRLAQPSVQGGFARSDDLRILNAIKAQFPETYRAMQDARDGKGDQTPPEIVRSLMADHMLTIPLAPDATLVEFVRTRLVTLKALQAKDPQACGIYYASGLADPGDKAVSSAMTDNMLVMLKAIREGTDHPSARGARSPADRAALVGELARAGVDARTQRMISRPDFLLAASPADQCRAGIAFYTALSHLPADVQARTIATVIMVGAPRPAPPEQGYQ